VRWWLLILTLAGNAHAASPSFDCAHAGSDVERLICSNDDLAALDRDQVTRYLALSHVVSPDGRVFLLRRQRAWLASRAGCLKSPYSDRDAQIACLKQSYQEPPLEPDAQFRQAGGLVLEERQSERHIPSLRVKETDSHPWLTGTPATQVAAFNHYVSVRLALDKGMFASMPIKIDRPPQGATEYERFYEIHRFDGRLISVKVYIHHESYVGHAWRSEFALNWDLAAGNPVHVADLFRADAGWRAAVTEAARKWLTDNDDDKDLLDYVDNDALNDDEGWLFDDSGAVLMLGRGERSMVGLAEDVPVPWEVLTPLLKPDAPLRPPADR
jgi:uncharacterized protein YecT (DUF1311 family)